MKPNGKYTLPALDYDYDALEPYISKEQLEVHHKKHHQAYVDNTNKILEKLDNARKESEELDMKCTLKSLAFNLCGHILHETFWKCLIPKENYKDPEGLIAEAIEDQFESFENFKKEFSQAALNVEGSGWAALGYCKKTNRILLMQIEKHNYNIYPMYEFLLVLDMWEHAFYIDHKNAKAKFVENFWEIVNWDYVNNKLKNSF